MADNPLLPNFRALFSPDFDSISDAKVTIYLDQAGVIFSACQDAQLYLAAHLIVVDKTNNVGTEQGGSMDGGNGENTSEKVGEVQVDMKTMADTGLDTYYTSTPYGRRYLAFKKACPAYALSARAYPSARSHGNY